MHLLHPDDFMGMGVGSADARLLTEKYKTNLRRDELQAIVHDIRTRKSKKPSQKQPKKSTVCANLAWYHYGPGKSFSSVNLKDGGGSRRCSFERNAKLDEVYQKLKDIYFPNGKNTMKDYLVNLDCNMCDLNLENVNLNVTLNDYIRNNGFKYCKLILKAKKKTFLKDLGDTTSDEDEFKFEEIFKKKDQSKKYRQQQSMSAPTNSNSHFHNATKSTNGNSNGFPKRSIGEDMPWESTGREDSDFSSVTITADIPAKTTRESETGPSNVRTREQLISQQDQAFETSLKVDQEKEKEKLAMDELINFKIRKHFAMKRFIEKNPEP